MAESIKADGLACFLCAARTVVARESICEPWKLGQSNKANGKHKRFVFGRNHTSGTTMRPKDCPHPESKVLTTEDSRHKLKILFRK